MRILLVVDFSPRSDRAVAGLAARTWPADTIVRVLSVVENIPPLAAELWFDAGDRASHVLIILMLAGFFAAHWAEPRSLLSRILTQSSS